MHKYLKQIQRAGALLFMLFLLVGCEVIAYSNLSESDINEMIALLRNNKVHALKVDAGKGLWSLTVPDAELARALDILQAHGLPRLPRAGLGSVFKKEGMVSTPVEEQARMLFALSEEISTTISHIDGVLTARVHIVLPKIDNFGKKVTSATASVFIKHRDDVDMQSQIASIKKLVENSVPELQYASIAVSLFPSTIDIPHAIPSSTIDIDYKSLAIGALGSFILCCVLIFIFRKAKPKESVQHENLTTSEE